VIVLDTFLIVAMPILATIYIHTLIRRVDGKKKKKSMPVKRQSDNLTLFNDRILAILESQKPPKTQSTDYVARTSVRAIVIEDQIYWISDNAFYTANMVDGNIEENSTRLVDTMTMDKVQLEKMIFIVDKLREGD